MKSKKVILYLLSFLLGGANCVSAQDLNLFQNIIGSSGPSNSVVDSTDVIQRVESPIFTLKGTSRFGNEYHSSLVSRSGELVSVIWEEGSVSNISGFKGYQVINIGPRVVSFSSPPLES